MHTPSPHGSVLIIRNAHRYDFGGGERFPVNLGKELQKQGYVTVVVSRSPKLLGYAAVEGVAMRRGWWWSQQNWSGKHALLFPVYCLWQLALTGWYLQLILRLKPDVVHPQSKDDFIAATLAARLLGKRVIWTDHADLKYVFANHGIWYKNPVGKLVYACSKLAHAITLVSHNEAAHVSQVLGQPLGDRYTVIHNGINDARVTAVHRPADSFIYCATSRLVTAKGIGELLTAFASVRAVVPEAQLWLVGDGPQKEQFQTLAKDIAGVTFIGHADEPLAYVAAADVFVHPSYHEGFSLSLVEAAMLQKPIIATRTGGNPEIIVDGETGVLVPVKDSSSLSKAMLGLHQDGALAGQLAAGARAKYLAEFQFDRIVKERFVPLYEN